MKLKISASLKINKEYDDLFKQQANSTKELNAMLQKMLDEALKDNPIYDSWLVTGYLYEK